MEDSARAWRTCLDDHGRSAACAHQCHLLAGLLASSVVAVSPPCHPTAHLHLRASSTSQAIGWDTHGSWGTWGAPWLSPGQRCQCWEKDWAQLWLLGFQGLHKRLYNTPLPEVWVLLQFWLQNRKLQRSSKNIVWSFIYNKVMLQCQVQLQILCLKVWSEQWRCSWLSCAFVHLVKLGFKPAAGRWAEQTTGPCSHQLIWQEGNCKFTQKQHYMSRKRRGQA